MNKHTCVRPCCGISYEDNELDNYYCPSCNELRKANAKLIDSKFSTVGQERQMSDLEIFDASAHTMNQPNGRKISFMKA